MKKNVKGSVVSSSHYVRMQGNALNNANDIINRDDKLIDPMNFLLDLKEKMQQQDNQQKQMRLKTQSDSKYSDIEKRRRTSTSQDISHRTINKKVLFNTNSQNKNPTQPKQSIQVQNKCISDVDQFRSSDAQDMKLQRHQIHRMKLLEHSYNDLQLKIEVKDRLINDYVNKINSLELQLSNKYSNYEEYIEQLHSEIDQYYQVSDNQPSSYIVKIQQLGNLQDEDSIMTLMIDNKELKQRINELNEVIGQLQSQTETVDEICKDNEQLMAQNAELQQQCDLQVQQLQELSKMYDNTVDKYQIQVDALQQQQQTIQINKLSMQFQSNEQQFESVASNTQRNVGGDVNQSQIDFSVNFNQSNQNFSSITEQDQERFKDIFQQFQQQPHVENDELSALRVQNAHQQYIIEQMKQNINHNINQLTLRIVCQQMFIQSLRQCKQQNKVQMNELKDKLVQCQNVVALLQDSTQQQSDELLKKDMEIQMWRLNCEALEGHKHK